MTISTYTQSEIDTVVNHALIAWLWSETDEDGTPLDSTHSIHEVCVSTRDAWTREILCFCSSKGSLSYWEAVEQITHRVLENQDQWYNGIVNCRIHAKHVRPKL